jgi:hypothetical protein
VTIHRNTLIHEVVCSRFASVVPGLQREAWRPSTAAADLPSLPTHLLVKILEMVPQNHRLCKSALVCKAWASAATAATRRVSLEVNPDTVLRQAGVHAWLQQHSSSLSSLELRSPSSASLVEEDSLTTSTDIATPLHLPCAAYTQLTSLSLECMDLSYSTDEPAQAQQQQGTLPHLADLNLACVVSAMTKPSSHWQDQHA